MHIGNIFAPITMRIHFVGIGGIGISALAQYYLVKGHDVSGCDLVRSEITDALQKKGAKINIGKNTLKKDADLIIYSPAVKVGHHASNFLSYPQALGELTKKYFTIAVAGTHGKSTTTAMLGLLMTKAGLDPTVIVGTKVKEFCWSNCRVGKSKYLVIEADEHFASFLNYWPQIIIITNVEADHLDYYKNLSNVKKSFNKFIAHLPPSGILLDMRRPMATAHPTDRERLAKILKVPGEHNIANALGVLAAARTIKIPDTISFKALSRYRGAWRRFDVTKAKLNDAHFTLVSDYGHHPTEIAATLKAAKEKWPKRKIWCVFQPHQYQRSYYLFNDFIKTLKKAPTDRLIITDIYDVAGRENKKIKRAVNSEKIVKKINSDRIIYITKNEVFDYLVHNFPHKAVLIVMGAGDIYDLTKKFRNGT